MNELQLPRIDSDDTKEGFRHNPKGWAVVFSTFIVNFFCLGVFFQWGNYQRLYLKIYVGQIDAFGISFVGSVGTSTLLSSGVLLPPLIQKMGYRKTMMIGTILAPLGLALASLATELWHIYLTQGFVFGLGCGFVYSPSMALPSLWFKKNRALATGLAAAGSGAGALIISPLTENLIETIGYRNALRVQAAIGFGLLLLATILAFSDPAQGASKSPDQEKKRLGYRDLIVNTEFHFAIAYSLICYFGYFSPMFLAPQYTSYLGHSPADGAVMISVMSGLNSLARISMGFLADRYGNLNVITSCALAAGLSSSIIWQLASNYEAYIVFCIVYGIVGGAFVSLVPMMVVDIVGLENIQLGLGICYMATYFGNLLGPPISGELLQQYGWTAAIQFPGVVTVFSAIILFSLRMKRSEGKLLIKL